MSWRTLLMGMAVTVLALATIGAAFATGMDIFNVGALSSGTKAVSRVDTDHLGYTTCGTVDSLKVCKVIASFTKDLRAGAQIYAGVTANGEYIAKGKVVSKAKLDAHDEMGIPMNQLQKSFDPAASLAIRITVAER